MKVRTVLFQSYRTRLLFALSAFALIIAGCAQKAPPEPAPAPEPPPKIKIGFLVKMPQDNWFKAEWKHALQCAMDNNFELLPIGAMNGQEVMAAIDKLAEQKAQGFVICTPDVKLGPAIINKAETHNMKVYTVDDRFLGSNGEPMLDIPYMGIANDEVGKMAGQALYDEFVKREWSIEETGVCVVTCDAIESAKIRTDSATDALKAAGFPEDRIFTAPAELPNAKSAGDSVAELIGEHSDVTRWLVCSVNDETVLGAVKAMESAEINPGRIIGIGIGAGIISVGEFSNAKPSGFHASVLLEKRRHGYESTESLFKWITLKTRPPMETLTKGNLINRNNYKDVMKEQGLL